MVLAVDFGDANGHFLIEENGEVVVEFDIDLAGGHEGAGGADLEFETATIDAGDDGFDGVSGLEGFPSAVLDGAFAGEDDEAFTGVVSFIDEFVFLSDFDTFLDGAILSGWGILIELFDGADALALAADIDEDITAADAGDFALLDIIGD